MDEVRTFQALAIAKGLEIYAGTGVKVNKGYTPLRMMKAARRITGKTEKELKPRDYLGAAKALRSWVEDQHAGA